MDGSWVNLLRKSDPQAPTSPVRREILTRTPSRSRAEVAKSLRVSERTPQVRGLGGRKGVKKVAGIPASLSSSAAGLRGLGTRERRAQGRQDGEAEDLTVSTGISLAKIFIEKKFIPAVSNSALNAY